MWRMDKAVLTSEVLAANTNTDPAQQMLTVPQVAKLLGRGANTVRRFLEKGVFPNADCPPYAIAKIPLSDVLAWRAAHKPKILRRQRAA